MNIQKIFLLIMLLLTICTPIVYAEVDLSESLSSDDEDAFDEILEPVMNIYNFMKYIATVVAAMVLIVAGIVFMVSGGNTGKREMAKGMVSYVVIGVIVIWVAPLVVDFLVQ